ncbi:uncharacterized protein LOC133795697 [Humulus lupulus]|uniref:uncharacterized protein LOC133795697 n=1 Tax=Humulus lupulus TaxID=3486 RepID=UPI002B41854E|nr:uncharacterized protein LOC133795697 [Humulus lupulus]
MPPMKLLNNNSVLFYIELKKKQNAVTELPLCITTFDQTIAETIEHNIYEETQIQNTDLEMLVLQLNNQQSATELQYDEATCTTNNQVQTFPNITDIADNVADFIIERTKENKRKREEDTEIITDHKVSKLKKAWRAREKALELARGNQDDSYQKFPIYLHMLKVSNPDTITHLVTENKDHFKYMYLAFANSIKGRKHCRPLIVIDGTYLKTSFGGTLFTASTMDANNNIFPLAFGIEDSKNDSSWLWFFTKLKETYGKREDIAIISDRHKGIENAIDNVYPKAFHGACIFHLLNNIKVNFDVHGEDLNINFVKAAKAYRINDVLKAARTLPSTTMMEGLQSLVQKWVWKNGNEANGTFTQVTTNTETVLRETLFGPSKFQVFLVNTILYHVVVEDKGNFLVNQMEKTCECKRFQQDEIPCAHAIAVFAKTRLKTYDYVVDYNKTTTMKATYESIVHQLPNESEWTLPETLNKIVLPPKTRKPPGRPRRKRIRSRGEPKVQIKCGRCVQPGHNRKTCKNEPIPNSETQQSQINL